MNALVVYFSGYGNTRKVAEVIAQNLEANQSTRVIAMDEMSV